MPHFMDARILDLRLRLARDIVNTLRTSSRIDIQKRGGIVAHDFSKLSNNEVESFSTDRLLSIALKLGYKYKLEAV